MATILLFSGCLPEDYNLRVIDDPDRYYSGSMSDSTDTLMKWNTDTWKTTHAPYWRSGGIIITNPWNVFHSNGWLGDLVSDGFNGTVFVQYDEMDLVQTAYDDEYPWDDYLDIDKFLVNMNELKADYMDDVVGDMGGKADFVFVNASIFPRSENGFNYILNPSVWSNATFTAAIGAIYTSAFANATIDIGDTEGVVKFGVCLNDYTYQDWDMIDVWGLDGSEFTTNGEKSWDTFSASEVGDVVHVAQDAKLVFFNALNVPVLVKGNRLSNELADNTSLQTKLIQGYMIDDVSPSTISSVEIEIATLRGVYTPIDEYDALLIVAGVEDDVYHSSNPTTYSTLIRDIVDGGMYFTPGADGDTWDMPMTNPGEWWIRTDSDSKWVDMAPTYASDAEGPRRILDDPPVIPGVDEDFVSWNASFGSGPGTWDTDLSNDVAGYDLYTFAPYLQHGVVDLTEIVELNPDIRTSIYEAPGFSYRHEAYGNPLTELYELHRGLMWPHRVYTDSTAWTEEDPDGVECNGVNCDVFSISEALFLYHLADPEARAAMIQYYTASFAVYDSIYGPEAAETIGFFQDSIGPNINSVGWIQQSAEECNGRPDLDNDGENIDDDMSYDDGPLSEADAWRLGQIAFIEELKVAFPDRVMIVNGWLAWQDSVAIVESGMDYALLEDIPQWKPIGGTAGLPGLMAGTSTIIDYTPQIDLRGELWSLEKFARLEALGGAKQILNSSHFSDDEGDNYDEISILAKLYDFGTAKGGGELDPELSGFVPIDLTYHNILDELGDLIETHKIGEYIWGEFQNGEAHIMVNSGVGNSSVAYTKDDQVDYWAVTTGGDTLMSHFGYPSGYTHTYGVRTVVDQADRGFNAWHWGSCRHNVLTPDVATVQTLGAVTLHGLTSLPAGNGENVAIIDFNGYQGYQFGDMRDGLAGKPIELATLSVSAGWGDIVIPEGATLHFVGINDEDLVGWSKYSTGPIGDLDGGKQISTATWGKKSLEHDIDWSTALSSYTTNASIGGAVASIDGPFTLLTTDDPYELDVTQVIQYACELNSEQDDWERSWGGFFVWFESPDGDGPQLNITGTGNIQLYQLRLGCSSILSI